MATLYTVLDIESEVERVFAALFTTYFPSGMLITRSATGNELTVPRIEVVAEVQRTGSQRYIPATGTFAGRVFFTEYHVQLMVDLVVRVAASTGNLGIYRGKVRAALTDYATIRSAFTANGYQSAIGDSLKMTSGSRLINDAEKEETHRTVMQLVIVIPPAALDGATS